MKNKKQSTVRNYSIVALIFALLACIATFLFGIARGLISMQVFTWDVEDIQRYLLVSAGLVILFLSSYAIMEPDKVRRFFTGRQARYGSNAIVMSLAFLLILIFGNVLAHQYPKTLLDLTEDKTNTLSPELINALKALPEKVTATAFFSQNSNTESAEKLLSNVKASSNGKFAYDFIDPDRDPQAAIKAGITGDGKILLQMGDHQEIVAYASETEILKGMLRLLNPGNNMIYFLTGHGERSVEQPGDTSMTRAKETLESKNYTVKPLNLLVDNKIPEDASTIVIAGPIKPVSDNEVKLLKDYLANDGSLIVIQDATALTEFGESSDPLAKMLTTDWGISFNNDFVIDLNSPQPTTAAAAYYDTTHAITRNTNTLVTYFPFTQSLKTTEGMEGVTLNQLVQTGQKSWGEKDFESLTQGNSPSYDESTESLGPLTLVAAGENATTKGRVVVFGSSNFAIDPNFDVYGNGDMFVNSVDWAAEQEDLANITPKTPTERIFTTGEYWQLKWIAILLSSIFIIPGGVVLAGILTWLGRRRQG